MGATISTSEQGGKQRKPRTDAGPRVTERDLEALCWIAEQYAARLDQVQVLLSRLIDPEEYARKPKGQTITAKRALAIVRKWQAMGLVAYRWFLTDEPAWCWLTPEGLRLVADRVGAFRAFEPTPGGLQHLYYCNKARLFVEGRRPEINWTSERQLRGSQEPTERGLKRPHIPDATIETAQGLIAVEVELAAKSHPRLDAVLRELAATRDYATVWYFCMERSKGLVERRLEVLKDNAGYAPFVYKFAVYDLATLD